MIRRGGLIVVVGACSALVPASASAGTARVVLTPGDGRTPDSEHLDYTAAPGEANRLTITPQGTSAWLVVDSAGVTLGRRCVRPVAGDTTRARCTATELPDLAQVVASLRDGADSATIPGSVTAAVDGGAGNDRLTGEDLTGGAGDDVLISPAGGAAIFREGPGGGSDTIMGGAHAQDTVTYEGRTGRVRADLDGVRDDGETGEADLIRGVENLTGGRAADRLVGDSRANRLIGGRGSDSLRAGAGDDELYAYDPTEAGPGRPRDILDAGSGDDVVLGSNGADRVRLGRGQDQASLFGGAERLTSRDSSIDVIRCGRGRDRLKADFRDLASSCDRMRRSRSAGAIGYDNSTFWNDDEAPHVVVACPRDHRVTCRGTVSIVLDGRRIGRRRFRARAGREDVVRFPARLARRIDGRRVRVVTRSRDRRGRRRTTVLHAVFEVPFGSRIVL